MTNFRLCSTSEVKLTVYQNIDLQYKVCILVVQPDSFYKRSVLVLICQVSIMRVLKSNIRLIKLKLFSFVFLGGGSSRLTYIRVDITLLL